jgi:hypothetical protein
MNQPFRRNRSNANYSVFEPTGRANARPMTGSVDAGSREENASKLKITQQAEQRWTPSDFGWKATFSKSIFQSEIKLGTSGWSQP